MHVGGYQSTEDNTYSVLKMSYKVVFYLNIHFDPIVGGNCTSFKCPNLFPPSYAGYGNQGNQNYAQMPQVG